MRMRMRYLCSVVLVGATLITVNSASAWDVDECGFLKAGEAEGCLLFQADSGMVYELTTTTVKYTPGNRARVRANHDPNCQHDCPNVDGCIIGWVLPCYPTVGHFTTTQDFQQGEFINLNADNDRLQVNTWEQTKTTDPPVLPYLWVACSNRGTVVRIATARHYSPVHGRIVEVHDVLGEYRTAPDGCWSGTAGTTASPSRTTVNFDGSVWVANRYDIMDPSQKHRGHVVKIGSGLSFQWMDRDGHADLDTSTTLGTTTLDWKNEDENGQEDEECTSEDVRSAKDELILVYRVIDGNDQTMGTRTVAVDRENNVWVGGHYNRWHELIDGQDGSTITSIGQQDCGGYGGVVDCNGILWSARGGGWQDYLLRYNLDPEQGEQHAYCIDVGDSYGVAVDTNGFIWNSMYKENRIAKINPSTPFAPETSDRTDPEARWHKGVTVTPEDNDVWVASTGSRNVTRFYFDPYDPDTPIKVRKLIPLEFEGYVGDKPTGVAVDSRGYVWVTNVESNDVMRIDPVGGPDGLGQVDLRVFLGDGAEPYNYSDMTGMQLMAATSPAGTWTVVYDGETYGTTWENMCWVADPGSGNIIIQARAADHDYDLGGERYIDVHHGQPLNGALVGRYIQVRVQLDATCHTTPRPVLEELWINHDCPTEGTIVATDPPDETIDARQPHPPEDNSLDARQGIGSPNTYTGGPEPIVITLDVCGAGNVDCWELCETGIEEVEEGTPPLDPNEIISVTEREEEPGVYEVFLERPISAGHWTTITYLADGSYVSYASLPGDASGDGRVTVLDLGGLRGYILGGCDEGPPPHGEYGWDIDHNTVCQEADLDRWYDLSRGVDLFIWWHGKYLPENTCAPGGRGESRTSGSGTGEDDVRLVADWFVNYLTTSTLSDAAGEAQFRFFAEVGTEWLVECASSDEREALADCLQAPSLVFADPLAAEAIPEIVAALLE